MQKLRVQYLTVGFVAGMVYVAACGGVVNSIAETIGDAVDLVFDNSTSGMTAENAQDAIDELDERADELDGRADYLEGINLSTLLTGTWAGVEYCTQCETNGSEITITFNADETFSCDNYGGAVFSTLCRSATWTALKRITLFKDASGGTDGFIEVTYISATELEVVAHEDGRDEKSVVSLIKS